MWLQARSWIFFSILWETCIGTPPLALHQLVEVEPGGEVVLKLNGLDVDGDKVSHFQVRTLIFYVYSMKVSTQTHEFQRRWQL